ncbi:MAG: hypothetical protein R3E42_07945 [Burkholderiaceae bacterium]
MDDELAVLSGSSDNVEVLAALLKEHHEPDNPVSAGYRSFMPDEKVCEQTVGQLLPVPRSSCAMRLLVPGEV